MKDTFIALLVALPFLFFIVWMWGWSAGYRYAKIEDRKDKANCVLIGLGRVITLGQLSIKKKGGVM